MLRSLVFPVVCAFAASTFAAQEPVDPSLKFQLGLAEDASLELAAFWEPCRESLYDLFDQQEMLREPKAAKGRATYDAAAFAPFLPTEPVAVGDTWPVDREAAVLFLRQFHEGARSRLNHALGSRPGTWACLRAVGPEHVEILLRAHAEFILEGDVRFSPAQFEGRLVIKRESGALVSFSLALPSRNTNADVVVPFEHKPGPGQPVRKSSSADIGWIPRLELTSGEPPAIEWTREVSDDEARMLFKKHFYEFFAVDWLPFEEAVQSARKHGKPLFAMLLFGSLDDESC